MKKLVYTPDALEDLKEIKKYIRNRFDNDTAIKNFNRVIDGIKQLKTHTDIGISTKDKWGIDSEYKVVFVHRNYVFYTYDSEKVYIINVIDEREDVLWKMFRIH